jgi:uncharacterized protein YjdB
MKIGETAGVVLLALCVSSCQFVGGLFRTPVTGITLSQNTWSPSSIYHTLLLQVKLSPSDATDQRVFWKSSDPGAIGVSPTEGLYVTFVNPVAVGANPAAAPASAWKVTVTATTEDGGFSDQCVVDLYPLLGSY